MLSQVEEDPAADVEPPGGMRGSLQTNNILNNSSKLSPVSQRDSYARHEVGADTQGDYELQNGLEGLLLGDAKRVRAEGRGGFWSLGVRFARIEISYEAGHDLLQTQQQQQSLRGETPSDVLGALRPLSLLSDFISEGFEFLPLRVLQKLGLQSRQVRF